MLCPDMRVNAGMAAGAGGMVAGCATEGGAPNIKPATLHRPIESAVPVRLREAFVLTPPAVLCCARLGSLGRELGREPPPSCPGHAAVMRTRGPRAATGCVACVGDQKRGCARRSVVLNTAAGGARACLHACLHTGLGGRSRVSEPLCQDQAGEVQRCLLATPDRPLDCNPLVQDFLACSQSAYKVRRWPLLVCARVVPGVARTERRVPVLATKRTSPAASIFLPLPPSPRARARAVSRSPAHTPGDPPPATPAPAPLSVVRQFTQPVSVLCVQAYRQAENAD